MHTPVPQEPERAVAAPAAPPPPVAGNVSWRLAATAARLALSFISVPLLTRALGMSQWGLLALVQAATAPLVVLDLGMNASTVKHVAEAVGRGARDDAVRTVHGAMLFNAATGLAGALLLALLAPWLAESVFAIPAEQVRQGTAGFRLVAVNWFAAFTGSTLMAVVAAHQRYDRIAWVGVAVAFASTGGAVAVALAGGGIVAVLAVQAAAQALGAVAWYRSATLLLPGLRRLPRWDTQVFRRSFRFGRWTTVATLGTVISGWADRYVLGANFVPAVVGFYSIAHMLQTHLYGTFSDAGEVLFPAVSHRHGQGDLAGARRLVLLAGWASTIAFGTAATTLAAAGGDFIALWVSPETAGQATTVLRVLCAGGAVGIAAGAPLQYLLGTGHGREYATATVITAATIGGASLLLVPRLGLTGAGLGLACGVLVRTAFLAYVWRAVVGATATLREFAVHLWVAPIVSVASTIAFSIAHDRRPHAPTWPTLVLEILVVALCSGGLQLAIAEVMPGGRRRREDVVASFRPVVSRVLRCERPR